MYHLLQSLIPFVHPCINKGFVTDVFIIVSVFRKRMMRNLEMRKQLDAESESIRSLIAAASSISSAKDADAQSRFNVLAAIASVGIGLPALVLSLYGADILLPMNTGPRQLAFAPVALALLIAALIAMWQGVRLKRGKIWTAGAVGIVLVLLALLLAAGLLAPGRT